MHSSQRNKSRHSGDQPELDFHPERNGQLQEAAGPNEAASAEPPGSPSPVGPKRKYTRKAKPRPAENPPESAPTPGRNGQSLEAASTEADEWDLDALRVSQDYADGLGV
jgi:hypothetical protein